MSRVHGEEEIALEIFRKAQYSLGRLVSFVSSYGRGFQRMVCGAQMLCEMLEIDLQTYL